MRTKVFVWVFLLGAIWAQEVGAQDYFKAVGVRVGWLSGLSYKNYVTSINSFELLGMARNTGDVSLAAIYQWNLPLGKELGATWHIGPGLHTNFFADADVGYWNVGANANLGMEYILPGTPISVGVDYNLLLKIYGSGDLFTYDAVGVVLRYCWK